MWGPGRSIPQAAFGRKYPESLPTQASSIIATRIIAPRMFLLRSSVSAIRPPMPDAADKLLPAHPSDLAAALAFALRYQGRKRVHNADEIMAEIVAKRPVEHLERGLRRDGKAAADRRHCGA